MLPTRLDIWKKVHNNKFTSNALSYGIQIAKDHFIVWYTIVCYRYHNILLIAEQIVCCITKVGKNVSLEEDITNVV